MRLTCRISCFVCGCAMLLGGGLGCATSSHKSVQTYDYRDDGRTPEKVEAEPEESESEYHMVSPGEMVVDPGR